jgi:hypothetical protein
MRPRRRHSNLGPLTSNLCLFIRFRTLWPQRSTSKSFAINHFRTLSHPTGGGGSIGHPLVPPPCLFNDFHATAAPRSHHLPWCPLSRSSRGRPPLATVFPFQSLANCPRFATLSQPISFQPLTNCPICKSFLLKTIQQYRGVWGVRLLSNFPTFKRATFKRPLTPLECAVPKKGGGKGIHKKRLPTRRKVALANPQELSWRVRCVSHAITRGLE